MAKLPEPRRLLAWLALGLILLALCTTAIPPIWTHFRTFSWDDAEYLDHALAAYDHLAEYGLLGFPQYIMEQQRGVKPPLYIDTLALVLTLTGRARIVYAVGALSILAAGALALVLYGVFRKALGSRLEALCGTLLVISIPAVSHWAHQAYPDVQLTLLAVLAVALLLWQPVPRWWFAPALGLTMGLGLLAKTTFPVFTGLPILFWLAQSWRERRLLGRKLLLLAAAALIAAAVAATWYRHNLASALAYARNSYFQNPGYIPPIPQRIWMWTQFSMDQGVGYVLVALLGLAVVVGLVGLLRRQAGRPRAATLAPIVYYLLAAGPCMAMAMVTPTFAPNNRHILPALLMLAIVAYLLIVHLAARRVALVRWLVVLVALTQFVVARAANVPYPYERHVSGQALARLKQVFPAFHTMPPRYSGSPAVDLVMMAKAAQGLLPAKWYVTGNDGLVNASLLKMLARYYQAPVEFNYLTYFFWPDARCLERMAQTKQFDSVIVIYKHQSSYKDPLFNSLKQYDMVTSHVTNRANRFIPLPDASVVKSDYRLDLYVSDHQGQAGQGLRPLVANFSDAILLTGYQQRDGRLWVKAKKLRNLSYEYKLIVLATDEATKQTQRREQAPSVPWSTLDVGQELTFACALPPAGAAAPRLEVGLASMLDGRPLKLNNGQPSVRLAP